MKACTDQFTQPRIKEQLKIDTEIVLLKGFH